MSEQPTPELAGIQISSDPERDHEKSGDEEDEVRAVEEEMRQYRNWMDARDSLFRRADQRGISEARIARLMGHSRNTVRKSLGIG
ncbi:DUF6003 family protein [Streptomyces niveus]|uniref:DUF6003 family protein n=1 Tax=Streptomyces niveus TaxID=193462 RepID=UPI0036AF9025